MSDGLRVEVEGLADFLTDVRQAGIDATPLTNAATVNATTILQRNIRREAPHRTGSLQRSVLTSVRLPFGIVTAEESYARAVEDGTKPHTITPKNGKALYWKGAAHPVSSVKHPGTKANPFFARGIDASERSIEQQFVKVVERLIAIMAGR